MKSYVISGIQQMGIGVVNVMEAWEWYNKNFGMDCRVFEEEAEAKLMLPYTGGQPRSRHAILALNLQSGGGFEIWQYKGREPVSRKEPVRVGDLGILICKIKSKDIQKSISAFREKGIEIVSEPKADPSGKATFLVKDLYGNIFQIVEASDWFRNENKVTGGSYGAVIGVTDIEKSRVIYSDILGYDKVVYDKTDIQPDFAGLPGGDQKCRRVLLRRSEPFAGPFSKVLGNSEIELISTPVPGKRIFEGRFWGDPGFIHLCYDMRGMDELKKFCESKGYPFTVDSKKAHEGNSFDMGEAAGHFSYIEDPDGTLVEFVETHKIPLLKKLGWYLDLRKRDAYKALPDWMLGMMRFSRVKM
jgi:catechol 2,3-dioxygenase-like lactoylglutathione lyase family enzyme